MAATAAAARTGGGGRPAREGRLVAHDGGLAATRGEAMGDVDWVRLLGPVEVGRGSTPVAVGGPIGRLLLVQLVLAGGRSVPDDQAVDAVWGEWPPDSVAAALRVHMTKLRAGLRELGWTVDRRHHGYALVAGPSRVDVSDLERAEAEVAAGAGAGALEAAERGLALWRGPSLADVRRLPLGERLAAGLDRRREGLVDRRLELLLQLGRVHEVLAPLDRLVREDPLNEARWALLATALYRSGHPAEALRSLHDARKALAEEAGLSPGPALCDLERRILDHDLEDRAAPAATADLVAPSPGPRAGVPGELDAQAPAHLFGRDEQLSALAGMLAGVAERGSSAVARACGESGVGKSALVAHFARRAVADGAQVLYGWAEEDAVRPLGPLAAPLAALIAASPALRGDPAARVLGRLPGWGDPGEPDRPGREAVAPAAERARLVDAARTVLASGGGRGPLVVILDDVQWADELAVAAIRSVARHPVGRPLLVVLVERTGATSVLAGRGVTDLAVGPLRAGDVAAWAGRAGTDEWTERVLHLTGGLPLLLEDVLERVRGGAALADLDRSAGHRLLLDRSAGLLGHALDALTVAGVVGSSFRFDHVAAVLGTDELQLLEDLDAARRVGIVDYDLHDPGVVRFAHDLLRRAVVERVTPLHRMRLHARVVEAVAGLPPVVAVHHAQAAGRFADPATLVRLTEAAARALVDGFGFEQAGRILETTLERVGHGLAAGPRAALLTLLARTATALGDAPAARSHLGEALTLAVEAGDPRTVAEVVLTEALLGQSFAPDPEAPGRLERLLAELPAASRDLRFSVLRQLAFAHLDAGRMGDAAGALHRARSLASELGTASAEVALLNLEHWRWESAGDPARRKATVARAEELALDDPDPRLRARLLGMSLIERLHEGDAVAADRLAEEMSTLGSTCGEPHVEWLGLAARVTRPLLDGRLDEAYLAAERARTRGEEIGLEGVGTAYGAQAFALGWVTGDLRAFTGPLESLGVEGPDLAWRGARALALAVSGRPDDAAGELAALHGAVAEGGSSWLSFVGVALAVEAAAAVGDVEVLERAGPVLGRRRDDHVVLGTGALDLGPVARYLGLAAHALGRRHDAAGLLSAVASEPGSGRIWQVRAELDLARGGEPPSGDAGPTATGVAWGWLAAAGVP